MIHHIVWPIRKMANNPAYLFLGVVLTLITGMLAFSAIEDTSLLDGIYWASTTLTSVGYGDLSPASATGKVMTITFQLWSIFVLLPCAITNIVESVKIDTKALSHAEQEYILKYIEMDAERQGFGLGPQPHDYHDN